MMKRKSAEELDSILYFLSSTLTSMIEDNTVLARQNTELPRIGAGLANAEIASRLALFREQVWEVSQREAMLVTKMLRARYWTKELRRHEPHLRADIDTFLSATACFEAMAHNGAPDPQSVFDGHAHPKRFLADRMPGGRMAADMATSLLEQHEQMPEEDRRSADVPPQGYLIGGELSVEELDDVCDRFLTRLSVHYGWEDTEWESSGADGVGWPVRDVQSVTDAVEKSETEGREADDSSTLPKPASRRSG